MPALFLTECNENSNHNKYHASMQRLTECQIKTKDQKMFKQLQTHGTSKEKDAFCILSVTS